MSENNNETDDEIRKSNKFSLIILAIFFSVAIVSIIMIICFCTTLGRGLNNNDGAPKLFTREASNIDLDIESNNDFSLSVNCTIKPNKDISNLQLRFIFVDKDKSTITIKTEILGNVTENIQYTVSFSLTEFSVTEINKISMYYVAVSGGTVSYFA